MKKYFDSYALSVKQSWLICFVMFVVAQLLISGLLMAFSPLIPNWGASHPVFIVLGYALPFLLLFAYIFLVSKNEYRLREQAERPQPQWKTPQTGSLPLPLLLLLLGLALYALNIVVEPLTAWIPMPDFIKKLFEDMMGNSWGHIFTVVVLAALLEEWLMRGVALKGMLLKGYSPQKAIIWSALIFGIMHLNPWQTIPAFLLGCFFGWVYWRTRCIWLCIFLHALNNGTSTLLSHLFPEMGMDVSTYQLLGPFQYILLYILAIALGLAVVYYLHKKLPAGEQTQNPEPLKMAAIPVPLEAESPDTPDTHI
jgi:Predicted metal-dependent membrane protease